MALKLVQPTNRGKPGNLQISGMVRQGGRSIRVRKSTGTKDTTTALMQLRELERQLLGLLPSIDTLRLALETIILLAEGGRARELSRILNIAEKALALLPKHEDTR